MAATIGPTGQSPLACLNSRYVSKCQAKVVYGHELFLPWSLPLSCMGHASSMLRMLWITSSTGTPRSPHRLGKVMVFVGGKAKSSAISMYSRLPSTGSASPSKSLTMAWASELLPPDTSGRESHTARFKRWHRNTPKVFRDSCRLFVLTEVLFLNAIGVIVLHDHLTPRGQSTC